MIVLAGCTGDAKPGPAAIAPSFAQTGEFDDDRGAIQGFVLDDEVLPVPGVPILLSPIGATTVTALDGGFSFSLLEPGPYSLIVSTLGFHPANQPVDVVAGERKDVEVHLKKMVVLQPRVEQLSYTGFLECRWASFGSGKCGSTGICSGTTCYTTQPAADAIWTQDKNEFFFKLTGEDWEEIVIETRWQASSFATNPKTVTLFSYQGRPGNHEFGSSDPQLSPSWWNFTKGIPGQNERTPESLPQEPDGNLTLRAWLAVSGSILAAPYDEEDPAGVMYQTKYDMWVSIFYSQKAPEGYTAWND